MARKKIREYDSKRLLKQYISALAGLKLPLQAAQVGMHPILMNFACVGCCARVQPKPSSFGRSCSYNINCFQLRKNTRIDVRAPGQDSAYCVCFGWMCAGQSEHELPGAAGSGEMAEYQQAGESKKTRALQQGRAGQGSHHMGSSASDFRLLEPGGPSCTSPASVRIQMDPAGRSGRWRRW